MSRWTLTAAALVAAFFSGLPAASAHWGHEHEGPPAASRTWTWAETGAHLHGAFVAAKKGQVQVRRDDGRLVSLVIAQLSGDDQRWLANKLAEIRRLNEQFPREGQLVAAPNAQPHAPAARLAKAFEPFAKRSSVTYRSDNRFFYVESNGMPDHPLMIGITAWQQQVPLPQKYTGDNAWRIPLFPVPAKDPLSAKSHFFRGAIALAVNGVPIFNPIKNDGRTDTLLAGELDEYGGHCGRADDYHYHVAPVHLEKQVGKGSVIAYALDGYPIYGYSESDGSEVQGLDWLNGHEDAEGRYHYHATKTYPYLNGGFYGEVIERDGQVDPQPFAQGVRAALPPLRGAKIVAFTAAKPRSYRLTYDLGGRQGHVNYTIADNGSVAFEFVDPSGASASQTYEPGRRPPPGGGKRDENRPPPGKGNDAPGKGKGKTKGGARPPGKGQRPPPADARETKNPAVDQAVARPHSDLPQLIVQSSALDARGNLGVEYTCDGQSASPPVEWQGAPRGTKSFALSLWHTAPDQEKSYWVLYNIPASTTSIGKNSPAVGKTGLNDKRRHEYDPMCSKGPGVKNYHLTIYALSEELTLAPEQATRANLLTAIKHLTLAQGTLDFQYERQGAN